MHMASRPGGSSAPPSADLLPTFTYSGAGPLVFPPRGIRLKFALPGAASASASLLAAVTVAVEQTPGRSC